MRGRVGGILIVCPFRRAASSKVMRGRVGGILIVCPFRRAGAGGSKLNAYYSGPAADVRARFQGGRRVPPRRAPRSACRPRFIKKNLHARVGFSGDLRSYQVEPSGAAKARRYRETTLGEHPTRAPPERPRYPSRAVLQTFARRGPYMFRLSQ